MNNRGARNLNGAFVELSQLGDWSLWDEHVFTEYPDAVRMKEYTALKDNMGRIFGADGQQIRSIREKYKSLGVFINNANGSQTFQIQGPFQVVKYAWFTMWMMEERANILRIEYGRRLLRILFSVNPKMKRKRSAGESILNYVKKESAVQQPRWRCTHYKIRGSVADRRSESPRMAISRSIFGNIAHYASCGTC